MNERGGRDPEERLARLLLLPLLAFIAYEAVASDWRSAIVCDSRTYLEMIRGIAEHGLPWLDNDPMGPFPELQARWNVVHGGHLWGGYPPVFPYVVAPLFKLWGLRAIPMFNHAAVAAIALGTFALARRVLARPAAAIAATYLTLVSTPVWGGAIDPSPYPLLVAFVVWHVYFVHRALGGEGRGALLSAGLLGGLAVATHLLAFPVVAATTCALALAWESPEAAFGGVRALVPDRTTLVRAARCVLVAAAPLALVAALNEVRFGSLNPLSYGPCTWRTCVVDEVAGQSIGQMLKFALPVIGWLLGSAACVWFVRRSRAGMAIVVAASLLVLSPVRSGLHEHAMALAGTAWAWIVDSSDAGTGFEAFDGFGNFIGPHVTKSLLQDTPVLVLALFARPKLPRDRAGLAVLAFPAAALFVMVTLRGNINLRAALGSPYIHMRYLAPALPLLAILATSTLARLSLTRAQIIVAIFVGLGLADWFSWTLNDFGFVRRIVLLRVTVVVAGALTLLAIRSRVTGGTRALAWMAAFAIALGIGITLGVDFVGLRALTKAANERYDYLARITPQRFALIGWGADIELSLRATRDVAYADLIESTGFANARELIRIWTAEGRPVYAVWPGADPKSPWPDLELESIDRAHSLFRVVAVRQTSDAPGMLRFAP